MQSESTPRIRADPKALAIRRSQCGQVGANQAGERPLETVYVAAHRHPRAARW